jgi:hypothetical protein
MGTGCGCTVFPGSRKCLTAAITLNIAQIFNEITLEVAIAALKDVRVYPDNEPLGTTALGARALPGSSALFSESRFIPHQVEECHDNSHDEMMI